MKDKYLPIGSVVLLKGGKKRLMIIGYAQVDMGNITTVYDYSGCMFPEGIISQDKTILFNHSDIERIFCYGYQDEKGVSFINKLKETLTPENIAKIIEIAKESSD